MEYQGFFPVEYLPECFYPEGYLPDTSALQKGKRVVIEVDFSGIQERTAELNYEFQVRADRNYSFDMEVDLDN